MKKALIAMSGGVDSSVAAAVMKDRGYDCVGVTMKLYTNSEIGIKDTNSCCSADDIADARSVAFSLGIPHYVFNFTADFENEVIKRFVTQYETGGTPNPCIDCNRYIKFNALFNRAKEIGCEYIVTGHYARIKYDAVSGRYKLYKAVDKSKDQSYVLYSMTQQELAHTVFPLGEYNKTEVREIAEQKGLLTARKHDSQDICFVPDGDYAAFIEKYTGKEYPSGDFVDKQGNKLGTHNGIIRYTIGQRKGLGLALCKPMYVCEKDVVNNRVVLGENDSLMCREFDAEDFNWISYDRVDSPMYATVKTRYKCTESGAKVIPTSDSSVHIVLEQPQRAVTSGQAVVLYNGDEVLGGGTIV